MASKTKPKAGSVRKALRYKVVETSTVTDDRLQEVLNEVTADGWHFDSIQFVRTDASKRPTMAFLIFTREEEESVGDE